MKNRINETIASILCGLAGLAMWGSFVGYLATKHLPPIV